VGAAGDPLVEKLRDRVDRIKVGPGEEKGIDMGPLITAPHRERVQKLIDSGVSEGAKLVRDGRGLKIPGKETGFYLGPSLFDKVSTTMEIYKEEIFGPVLIVLRANNIDEAIRIINNNPYGNGTAIFTRSGAHARRFEHDIEVGMVGINVPIPVPMAFFSFGGWKASLFGDLHVHGMEGVNFYTRSKVVTSRWPAVEEESSTSLSMPTLG
jgi:malonate-semialdehyde dehydrogenase (acetylating)/methylmalonate-semialdehyde dehydrogenase